CETLVHALRGGGNHLFFGARERTSLVGKAFDSGRVAVSGNQGVQRVNEAPGRTVDAGLLAGVDVVSGTASPMLAAGDEFEFHDTFRAEHNGDAAIEIL